MMRPSSHQKGAADSQRDVRRRRTAKMAMTRVMTLAMIILKDSL